jgi:hypothetical protein
MLLRALIMVSAAIQNCGGPYDLAVYKDGSFSPNPPMPGKNSTLSFSYYLKEPLRSGTATYSTKINFVPFPPTSEPLTQCPLSVGEHTESMSSIFPVGLTGRVETRIQWKTTDGRPILCVQGLFTL